HGQASCRCSAASSIIPAPIAAIARRNRARYMRRAHDLARDLLLFSSPRRCRVSSALAAPRGVLAGALGPEDRLLPLEAPAIAAEAAVAAHGAVAGDEDRDRVGSAGATHRALGLGRAERRRELGIGPRLAERNLGERLPDAALECRAAYVERQCS